MRTSNKSSLLIVALIAILWFFGLQVIDNQEWNLHGVETNFMLHGAEACAVLIIALCLVIFLLERNR